MKKIITTLFACAAFVLSTTAQMGKAYDMKINGVKVIVQPSGNDIVVIHTVIKGGVQNYSLEKEGIESLAMTALTECGTTQHDKNAYKNALDKVSARVSGSSQMEYSTFSVNCIKSDFNTVWPLYTEAMLMPKFDTKEFERIKSDAVNNIRASESSPDNSLYKMATKNTFKGKNYEKDPQGSVATVEKLTPEETKKHWESIFTRSRMTIVVVADLDRATLEKQLTAFLSKIPAGKPFTLKKEPLNVAANTFTPMERENATNYIQGITGGPAPGTPDYNAFVLAMRVFSSRHFVEVRTKNGLSYAPGAWFDGGTTNFSNLSVTTTEPDKYIAVARQLIDKVKKDGFTASELKNIKVQYLTNVFSRQETNDAQAMSLVVNEVVHGNWKRANTIADEMKKVTLEQMNAAFKKYITNISWNYQGDPKKVTPALYTQKERPKLPEEKKAF